MGIGASIHPSEEMISEPVVWLMELICLEWNIRELFETYHLRNPEVRRLEDLK